MMNNGILNFLTSLMNQSDLPKLICLIISTQQKSILLFYGKIFKFFLSFCYRPILPLESHFTFSIWWSLATGPSLCDGCYKEDAIFLDQIFRMNVIWISEMITAKLLYVTRLWKFHFLQSIEIKETFSNQLNWLVTSFPIPAVRVSLIFYIRCKQPE